MAIVEQKWSALPVPFAIEVPDRVPKERYYDPDFYRLEAEQLWPRAWQMACRLEEIPQPGDFAEYEILDQSVSSCAPRTWACAPSTTRAATAASASPRAGAPSRAASSARSTAGATGPTARTRGSPRPGGSPSTTSSRRELNLTAGALRDLGRLRLDQSRRRRPAAARSAWSRSPRCSTPGRWSRCGPSGGTPPGSRSTGSSAWRRSSSSTTCCSRIRSCGSPGRYPGGATEFDPRAFVEAELAVPAHDERRAWRAWSTPGTCRSPRRWRTLELPADFRRRACRRGTGRSTTPWCSAHRVPGLRHARPQRAGGAGVDDTMWYCFPHFFVLPMYSSATSYRFRPLGPEETPHGHVVAHPVPARRRAGDAARPRALGRTTTRGGRPSRRRTSRTCPSNSAGLHARTFEYMRLSERNEGHISNYQRVIDGFLAGLPDREAAARRCGRST